MVVADIEDPVCFRSGIFTGCNNSKSASSCRETPGNKAKTSCDSHYSDNQDFWASRATARSDLRAAGWQDADFRKPLVTIALPWTNAIPCNNHLQELAEVARKHLESAEPVAVEQSIDKSTSRVSLPTMTVVASTPVVSDGMTNGLPAMRYFLSSRHRIHQE